MCIPRLKAGDEFKTEVSYAPIPSLFNPVTVKTDLFKREIA